MTQPALPPPRTQTMYRPDGTAVEVPLGEVAQAYRTGQAGFAEGQEVHVADPSQGGIAKMTGTQAADFFASSKSYGTQAAAAGDYADQERRKQLEGIGHEAAAVGIGAASGLTIGLSDKIATEVGGEGTRKYLQDQRRFNPGLTTAGEVAGMAAPLLVTGGGSAAASGAGVAARGARLATALPRAVTGLGEAAGLAAERGIVGLGAEAGGKLAGAGRVLAQNAAEGAVYGAGQVVSETAIKNEPLTTEKLLAGAGHGALLGGILGGGLHGSLALGKMGVAKAGDVVSGVARGARESLMEKLADRVGKGAASDAVAVGEKAAPGTVAAFKDKARAFLDSAASGDVAAMERQGGEFLAKRMAEEIGIDTAGKTQRQLLTEIADKQSISSLVGTSERAQKKLDKLTKEARGMMPELIEDDLRRIAGKKRGEAMSRELMAESAPVLKKEAGQKMDDILEKFEVASKGDDALRPNLTASRDRIEAEVIEPMLAEVRVTMPDGTVRWKDGGTRAKVARDIRSITDAHAGSTSFKDMHQSRQFFDESVNFSPTSQADKVKSQAMRQAREVMDNELVKAGDRAQGFAGGESALEWQAAKNRWAAANAIADNAARGASKDAKNRVFGLSEQLGATRGAALGAAAGGALGSVVPVFGTAVGTLAGGFLGGHAGAYGQSMIRRYGDQTIAKIARDATTDGLLRSGMNEVDRLLDAKLGTAVGEAGIKAAAAAKKDAAGLAKKAESAIDDALSTRTSVASEAEPGRVRRSVLAKISEAKEAVGSRVEAAKGAAGRVVKALPTSAAVAGEGRRIASRAEDNRADEYKATRQRYADLISSPQTIASAVDPIRQVRPDVAKSLETKLAEISAYLDKKAPPSLAGFTLTPKAAVPLPSKAQRDKWLGIVEVAENPIKVLDHLADGTITREQMQTVKDLYPALHGEIVQKVIEKTADMDRPLDYGQRLKLGILLGAPTDPSLVPSFVSSTQDAFSSGGGGQSNSSPPLRQRKTTSSVSLATRMDKVGLDD